MISGSSTVCLLRNLIVSAGQLVCFSLVSTCSFSQWCRARILLPLFGSSGLWPTAVPGWLYLLSRWLFKWIWAQETKSNNFKISLNQTLKLNPLSKRCVIHFQVDYKWHCIYHPLHRITVVYVLSTVKLECWPDQRFWVWWILFGKITTHFFLSTISVVESMLLE